MITLYSSYELSPLLIFFHNKKKGDNYIVPMIYQPYLSLFWLNILNDRHLAPGNYATVTLLLSLNGSINNAAQLSLAVI